MATQVINGMKFVVETDSERAEQKIRSVADSAVAAQKKIDQAGMGASGTAEGQSRGSNTPTNRPPQSKTQKVEQKQQSPSPAVPTYDMKQFIRHLGAVSSLGTNSAASWMSIGGISKKVGSYLKNSMIWAGKKVGGMLQSAIEAGGLRVATRIADSYFDRSMKFQELSTDIKRGFFDVDKEDIENAKKRGGYEGAKEGSEIGGEMGETLGSAFGSMGSFLFGIAGRIIGGFGGYFRGKNEEGEKKKQEIENRNQRERRERTEGDEIRTFRLEKRLSDFGYQELLSRASGRTERIEILKDQLRQIKEGEGKYSIKNLEKKWSGMSEGDRNTTYGGKMIKNLLMSQYERADNLKYEIARLKVNPITSMVEPDTYADELSRKGLYAGAQIDARGVNDQILDQLKIVANLLRTEFAEQRTEVGNFKQESTLLSF